MNEELYQALLDIVKTVRPVRAWQETVDHHKRIEGENAPTYAKERLAQVAEPFKAACERFITAYNALYKID